MIQQRHIADRLENWARWATGTTRGRAADSMTGALCESLRRASLGFVWSGHPANNMTDAEEADALLLEQNMRKMPLHLLLFLWWFYIRRAQPGVICRKISIRMRNYEECKKQAHIAIARCVDNAQK